MQYRSYLLPLLCFLASATLLSCASIPKKASAVNNFNIENYLGTWYELARFDYRFERNLDNVSAQYSRREDGKIKVLNSGYNFVEKEWKSATGKAKFSRDSTVAALKVSFFGPFYTGYNVIAIDKNYTYAMVAGKNLNYLWILSRKKTIPAAIRKQYLKQAQEIGYDTTALIWVKHDKNNPGLGKNTSNGEE